MTSVPVVEPRPLRRREVDRATLLDRWRRLPAVDVKAFRDDLDRVVDPRL